MRHTATLALGILFANAAPVYAGMPNITLTDAASMRLQSISFFLVVFLLSALVIRWIWNAFTKEFSWLPRLSYWKSLGLVGLWGLLFLLVLTMISGARELMTPGAWKKDGLTYTLGEEKKPQEPTAPAPLTEEERRRKLLLLFTSLKEYAAAHEGHFPSANETTIPNHLWRTPHACGMRYIYLPNRTISDGGRVLACEPELFGDGRLVLFTNGDIRRMTSAELAPLLTEAK
jgi:hypothetical protein